MGVRRDAVGWKTRPFPFARGEGTLPPIASKGKTAPGSSASPSNYGSAPPVP